MLGEKFTPSPAVRAYQRARMAWEEGQGQATDLSFRAAADLRTLQYTFVKQDANGDIIAASAAGEMCIGVLQNKPNTGETAVVRVLGLSKVKVSAAIGSNVQVATTAAGLAKVAARLVQASGNASFVMGVCLRASTAVNQIVPVDIQRSGTWGTVDV